MAQLSTSTPWQIDYDISAYPHPLGLESHNMSTSVLLDIHHIQPATGGIFLSRGCEIYDQQPR